MGSYWPVERSKVEDSRASTVSRLFPSLTTTVTCLFCLLEPEPVGYCVTMYASIR